ncbi:MULTISPECIES: hypothetical protein [unclassified Tolypothrix]|uniref:hypothetical protein n=1 Tax=unclassified Tolypothrix TaxID=2649714 RepID=UPI0005EAA72F|nr:MULTISPECIES: hypothetical protein [unclassified Tolypothrix]EKE97668.1 hypothetical protein FDUTEX481_05046 [Tolypothrix sp. PCC 7601]
MAGFDAGKVKGLYKIPQGYEPVAAIALHYPGDPQTPTKLCVHWWLGIGKIRGM